MNSKLISITDKFPEFLRNPNPEIYNNENYIVIDFETTNKDKGSPLNPDNKIVLSVWFLGPGHPARLRGEPPLYVCWRTEYELSNLVGHIEEADFFVAHNSKFEFGWLSRCGLDLYRTLAFCTQIAEYKIAGNRKWPLNLDDTLLRYGLEGKNEVVSKLIKAGVCPSEIPRSWLLQYCIMDVLNTNDLFRNLRSSLSRDNLLSVTFTANLFTPVLFYLERRGCHLEKERVTKLFTKANNRKYELEIELRDKYGNINWSSPPQKRKILYEELEFEPVKDYYGNVILTPKKELPTNQKVIPKLKAKTKEQKQFLKTYNELNYLNNLLSKNLNNMMECVEKTEDSILHFQYNQTVTGTHRLSSVGYDYKMQGQNLPRNLKPLFSARNPGWKIGEPDQAQLEYATAVCMANDKAGIKSIKNGVDRHGITATIIFGDSWRDSPDSSSIRTAAKSHTFKPLYGGTSGTKKEREYYEAFKKEHKEITQMQHEWIDEVLRTKQLVTVTGLIFYWPDTRVTSNGYITNTNNICNYPVQYFATGEIVPIGVIYLWHVMKALEMQSFLINTIHDSAPAEIHPDEIELFKDAAVYSMVDLTKEYLKKVYNFDFHVPLKVEVSVEDFWSDSERWREENNV